MTRRNARKRVQTSTRAGVEVDGDRPEGAPQHRARGRLLDRDEDRDHGERRPVARRRGLARDRPGTATDVTKIGRSPAAGTGCGKVLTFSATTRFRDTKVEPDRAGP